MSVTVERTQSLYSNSGSTTKYLTETEERRGRLKSLWLLPPKTQTISFAHLIIPSNPTFLFALQNK